jgi:NAD(P)-dependent dehydrogenase (short-subunit alcohol dehydrogenase family)
MALVTGGSQGIGREITRQLAQRGDAVHFTYRSRQDLANELVDQVTSEGGNAIAHFMDVKDESTICALFDTLAKQPGYLDYLVNAAGIDLPASIETKALSFWKHVIDVNLTGKYTVLSYAIPLLKQSSHPRVVNVASRLAWKPLREAAAYCASQAGIIMLTKVAALELADYGIRVNAVCPGLTPTGMTQTIYPDATKWIQAANSHLLKRLGTPADIAKAVRFLLSDQSDFINGDALVVDGGSLLQ